MSKVQSRRCVSLSKKVYAMIHEASDRLGRPMSQLVEEMIVAAYSSAQPAKPEPKPKPKAETKPEPKAETKPESRPEPKKAEPKVVEEKPTEPKATKWNSGSKFVPYKRPPGNVMGL